MRQTQSMRWLTDAGAGAWIGPRLQGWGRVGGVLPRGFEAYARILHPVAATRVDTAATGDEWDRRVIDEAIWPWAEVARRTGRIMHSLVQWDRLAGNEHQLTFDDGWRLGQTPVGFFDPALLSHLVGALDGHTGTPDDVVFGVWTGWGSLNGSVGVLSFWTAGDPVDVEAESAAIRAEHLASVSPEVSEAISAFTAAQRIGADQAAVLCLPGREYVLGSTSLHELSDPAWPLRAGMGWSRKFAGPMPQLIWPADHAWCVASEIDWDSTIVGGSRALIDAVLATDPLETFEVTPDDDLSFGGDTINAPRPTGS
jgi:hypothetical protein